MASGVEDVYLEDAIEGLPSKRRKILSKACEACQIKKSKCDSARPKCGSCNVKGISCIYKQRGHPGLRPGYGKAVEQRLSSLEENIEKINQTLQDVLGQVQGVKNISQAKQNAAETALGETPQQWQETQQQMLDLAPYTSASPTVQPTRSPDDDVPKNELPPEAIMEQLVNLFFEKVYPWAPIFYKPHFTANMQSADRQVLLHGIVVVAFRYWEHPNPSAELRESYIQHSRDKILLETIDTCSLISTQALALLAIDAIGHGPTPRTGKIMAVLHTAVRDLGLAKSHSFADIEVDTPLVRNEDPDDDLDLTIVEAEEKRRLFWLIYRQDQFSSVSRGQLGTISVKDIHLPYPAGEDEWGLSVVPKWFEAMPQLRPPIVQPPSSNLLWQYYIDVMVFLNRTNQLLIKPVNLSLPAYCQEWESNFRRLETALSSWFENLPRDVRDPPVSFDPVWVMLHATFHLNSIRMYTVAAFPSTSSPYLKPSASGRIHCRQCVRNVASLAASIQPDELERLDPMFAFVVWVAIRSLIILWTSGYETTYATLPTDLEPMMWTLREMGRHWPCAQRYLDIVQLILDTKNNPGGPTGLEIFNDTRRTAYGLQKRLGKLAGNASNQAFVNPLDFLDTPLLDSGEFDLGRGGSFGFSFGMVDDWL
ncbi:fungal-specific transcription factor domain-containing protein [Xylaria sp. FL0064]|nr:fungal-specific transcription factor domain-containing protein [Xylaria sp. FL0064]